jgi:hypothetical protein
MIIQEAAALWESLSQNHPFLGCRIKCFDIRHALECPLSPARDDLSENP